MSLIEYENLIGYHHTSRECDNDAAADEIKNVGAEDSTSFGLNRT